VLERIEAAVQDEDRVLSRLGGTARQALQSALARFAGENVKVISEGIKHLRDVLGIPFKFKPWGAIKLAANLQKAASFAPVLGLIPDLMDMVQQRQLRHSVNELKSQLETTFQELQPTDREAIVQTAFLVRPRLVEQLGVYEAHLPAMGEVTPALEGAKGDLIRLRPAGETA